MAFGSFNPDRQQAMLSDINVTPMVDVMLVLLVIFILTAPMLTHAIRLDLPRAQAAALPQQAATVRIALDADGKLFWNNEAVDPAGFDQRLAEASRMAPQPELQLHADKSTRYEAVAQVMAAAQARGLSKLGFVTDPKKENTHGQR
jgi:biopolymer transport protein ExbD